MDEVIADAPYEITEEFMKRLFNDYKIDYIIHGDDPCLLPDGTDAYALAKSAGRYKQIKRTEGVSSTDIVGTTIILSCTRLCVLERIKWQGIYVHLPSCFSEFLCANYRTSSFETLNKKSKIVSSLLMTFCQNESIHYRHVVDYCLTLIVLLTRLQYKYNHL